jgi:hypothetical protein
MSIGVDAPRASDFKHTVSAGCSRHAMLSDCLFRKLTIKLLGISTAAWPVDPTW